MLLGVAGDLLRSHDSSLRRGRLDAHPLVADRDGLRLLARSDRSVTRLLLAIFGAPDFGDLNSLCLRARITRA
jgi:hypothetical protein